MLKKQKVRWLLYCFLFVIFSFVLYWEISSPAQNGLYIQKQTGLFIVESNTPIAEFSLPLLWVKSTPFSSEPVIDEVLLYSNGEVVSKVIGPFSFEGENEKWYQSTITGTIPLMLNGHQEYKRGAIITKGLSTQHKKEIRPDQLVLKIRGKSVKYSLKDTFSIRIFPKDNFRNSSEKGEVSSFYMVYSDEESNHPRGWVVKLKNVWNVTLEDIGFWMPGVPEDYFSKHVLLTHNKKDDFFTDMRGFDGELFDLPVTIDDHALVYFPLLPEMKEYIKDSLVHFRPYFEVSFADERTYIITGGSSTGPFHREKPWNEHLIRPVP